MKVPARSRMSPMLPIRVRVFRVFRVVFLGLFVIEFPFSFVFLEIKFSVSKTWSSLLTDFIIIHDFERVCLSRFFVCLIVYKLFAAEYFR